MFRAHSRSLWFGIVGVAAAAAIPAACHDPIPAPVATAHIASHPAELRSGSDEKAVKRQIDELRKLTKPFRSFEAASKAGWGTKITECFQDPTLGGMGFHYGNTAYIDGVVDASKPELLLYEPEKKGKLRFVAVEFIVPFTEWKSPEPPKLYGQSFHRNETFQLWVLHVWHEKRNPNGIFMDWNPKVSCARAGT